MMSTNSANWILVTGTSTGIGRAATFTLAENGYRVLAAVRKQEDIESLMTEAGTSQTPLSRSVICRHGVPIEVSNRFGLRTCDFYALGTVGIQNSVV